jgi:hypothetical protein
MKSLTQSAQLRASGTIRGVFHMRAILLAAVGAGALMAASPAGATLQIAFANGGSTFFCADQTSCDLDGAAKNELLLNTIVGGIKVVGTFAASTIHPDTLSVSNLTITNTSNTAETLLMAVGDTDFTGPTSFIRSSGSGTFTADDGGSALLRFFASSGDIQPATNATNLPGALEFSESLNVTNSPDSFSGTKNTPFGALGPFSMAEGGSITLAPGASLTGFNESMAAGAVPEPSTWAMLGIGFGLMGLVGYRKTRRALV